MGLEAGTYIDDLVATNPVSGDLRAQGDDHIRLLKTVLKTTFPRAGKAFYFPTTAVKSADFTVISSDQNITFLVTTAAGAVTATLPTLVAGDAGWRCYFLKTSSDVNPTFIAPPGGTLQSGDLTGLAKTRRAIPGKPIAAIWTGTAWVVERAVNEPVGSLIDFDGAVVPVGFELPNGQTLAGASGSLYPDYFARKGSLGTRDVTGRVVAMKEAVATRLTAALGGVDGATFGAVGGGEGNTLTAAQIPPHLHPITDKQHHHTSGPAGKTVAEGNANIAAGGVGLATPIDMSTINTGDAFTGITSTDNNVGGGNAHPNVQPTIVLNKLLVVE